MKIAFVDLLFSWPANGGADVDLYNTAAALQRAGHELRLIVTHLEGSWERGACDPSALPFPCQRLDFAPANFDAKTIEQKIAASLQDDPPEAIFLCDGFFLKHRIQKAIEPYPYAIRYYAYEMACHRNILRFRNGAPCPNAYLETPAECRRCALEFLGPELRAARHNAWIDEYLAAEAAGPGYFDAFENALRGAEAAVVYNQGMADLVSEYTTAHIVPGGVDADAFAFVDAPQGADTKTILMTGRGEDPMKGASILLEAGEQLRKARSDFRIEITMPEDSNGPDWFAPVGRCTHEETRRLYATSDIVVVPSIWEEPFGMVAVEAMATGRPVVASRTGGLQHIVQHEQTGLLFERGNAEELANRLSLLLDDEEMRRAMGRAGRAQVEAEYTWDRIVEKHYPAILDRLAHAGKSKHA